jgi:hypothetical protein
MLLCIAMRLELRLVLRLAMRCDFAIAVCCDTIEIAIHYAVQSLLLFHCGAVGGVSGDNDGRAIML